ncbi:MAG TPA: hypothetical protein PJ991_03775 [Kiritimatiellia bacterium]|nr:hypothetical protein [Kiritimatiellia bacterium]
MIRYTRWIVTVLSSVLIIGVATSCNSSSKKSSSGPSMSGKWDGTFGTGVKFSLELDQNDDALTGKYNTAGAEGTVTGSVNGNDVVMTITLNSGAVSEFTGQVDENRSIMAGTFKIIAGGGGSGQWAATKL